MLGNSIQKIPSASEMAGLTRYMPSRLASTFLGPVQKVQGKPDLFVYSGLSFG